MTLAQTTPAAQMPRADFLGHPKGLSVLFGTEMWERFNYYGMRAILVLYMVKFLMLPDHAGNVAGYAAVKSAFESVFGVLDVQSLASQIFGFFMALTWGSPLIGGWIADRYLGQRRSVYVGGIIMAAAEFMLAVPSLFFFAMTLMVIGVGMLKPNISTQVGSLYAQGDRRRDSAFSIFYLGINVGGLLGPLIVGGLGETVAWSYGFIAAGIGMLIGMAIYAFGQRHLPVDELKRAQRTQVEHPPLSREEWKAVVALLVVALLTSLYWAGWGQQFIVMMLWTDGFTDRHISLLGWSVEIPNTWFQALNPIMILSFTPGVVWFWSRQAARGREPSTIAKMAIACVMAALGFVVMAVAAVVDGGGKASPLWVLAWYAITTLSELYLMPVGLSLFTKVAPARMTSAMMGVWFLGPALGDYLCGWIGSYWSRMDKPTFFILNAVIAGVSAIAIGAFIKPFKPILK